MNRKRLKIIFLFLSVANFAIAQDHIYSQFFNAPVYLNPALNGQFNGDLRLNMIYRNQWTAVPGDLSYISASLDYQIPSFGGGIGLIFNRGSEGSAYLKKNSIATVYSYSIGSGDFVVSFGLQGGVSNRSIDFSKLVFGDQIDPSTGIMLGSGTTAEQPENNNKYYFDAATGLNFVMGKAMIGGAIFHINKPDESLTGSPVTLPIRQVIHASYRMPLDKWNDEDGPFIIPSVVIYNQAKVTSYSTGVQFKQKSINAGLWYRSNKGGGSDAFVVSLIFDISTNHNTDEKIRMGISHDATTSKINYTNTSGTSEISVGYEKSFQNSGSINRLEGRRCYDFY